MKLTGLVHLASLAASVLGSPAADAPTSGNPRLASRAALEDRAAKCATTSDCSWGYAGKCEQFCRDLNLDFRKMEWRKGVNSCGVGEGHGCTKQKTSHG